MTAGIERSFTRRLREEAAPVLSPIAFVFDGRRTFRRFPEGRACAQIVNFQLGDRFLSGTFTVNVAVYDPARGGAGVDPKRALEHHCAPALRQRLGFLMPGRLRALERLPIAGIFFRPRDTWWPADDATAITAATEAVIAYGVPWLEARTPGESAPSWR
jgi:hypothetical protein